MARTGGENRQTVAVDGVAVNGHGRDSTADMGRVGDFDVIDRATETAGDFEAVPLRRDARVDDQAVVIGTDAEDELGDGIPVPGGGAGKP